jgi:hypothetical protein
MENATALMERRDLRRSLVIMGGFTAALCWWVGILGVATSGGGAVPFLATPFLISVGTVVAARQGRRRRPRHLGAPHCPPDRTRSLPATRYSLAIITGSTAALCWWVGIVAMASTGGGAVLFLTVPALLTVGTLLVARRGYQALSG